MNFKFKKLDMKNPKTQVGVLMVLLAVLGGYVWYSQVIEPNSAEAVRLEAEHQSKQAELNTIYAMMPQLKKLRADVERMNLQLDSLRSMFPDSKEVPRLIREITRMGRESGIFTTRFVPGQDIEREYYIENNYDVSVIGGYHQLALFFSYLADFDLIVNLTGMKLAVNPTIGESIKEYEEHGGTVQTVFATFKLTTFSSRK